MVAMASGLRWRRARRDIVLTAVALALLWAGLVVSLSETGFGALLFGLAIMASVVWNPRVIAAAACAALVVLVVVLLAAPGTLGFENSSFEGVDKATSGRAA